MGVTQLNLIKKKLLNLPGWRTNKKLIILESDDWGSVRMPSTLSHDKLHCQGVDLGKGRETYRYNLFDTLASGDDLELLFELLASFRDHLGNHPILTAVSLVANPDFKRIKESDFEQYFFEPFPVTLDRYGKKDSFELWKIGEREGVFWPEFHGREHLNVPVWMRLLKHGDSSTMKAFNQSCWGIRNKHPLNINYQAAFDLEKQEDLILHRDILLSGLELFENLHKRKAQFFVPPNGPFNNTLEQPLAEMGVRFISKSKIQREPKGLGKFKTRFNWLGKKNIHGQRYLTRNCFFEPGAMSKDWVTSCVKEIDQAFKMHKPAIVSTHRVNYIGGLDVQNRDNGLRKLKCLIKDILKTWPDAEFITSSQLGELIEQKSN